MLIEHYDLEVFTPPCDPGAERYSAIARLTIDISAALPYLNATLCGAIYNRAANALTWTDGGHNIAFHAYKIAASNVEDRNAATEEIDGLIALVNRTWERRAQTTPNYAVRQRPTPLAVYKLLPQTNCRQCGEATCMAFAFGLLQHGRALAECQLIRTDRAFADRRAALEAML